MQTPSEPDSRIPDGSVAGFQRPDALSLDQPSPMSPGATALGLTAMAVVLLLALALLLTGPSTWPMIPAVVTAQSAAMAMVCGFTALPLFGYAGSSGQRGFLILGGTYLYVCLLSLVSPLFSSGLIPEDPTYALLGSVQSPHYAYLAWNLVFIVGVVASAVVLDRDQLSGRRPGLPDKAVAVSAAIVVAAFLVTIAVLTWMADSLPPLVNRTMLTNPAVALNMVAILICVCGVGYLLRVVSQRGSVINRWLLVVVFVMLIETIVVIRPMLNLYTFYANRLFGLVALCTLLVFLMRRLSRVGRFQRFPVTVDTDTGASSRYALLARLTAELERSAGTRSRVALLWLDLDGFKSVNDQLGNAVGDEVLREVVRRITPLLRPGDEVGRLGGDELGILLCDRSGPVTDELLTATAELVVAAIREPIWVGDVAALVTVSVGVCVAPDDARGHQELLLSSELAMARAKESGGDRAVRFTADLVSSALQEARLRQELSASLRARAFDLDYQPIVDSATGRILAAECLVRWVKDGRRINGGRFVPFAERSGQILAIGQQVLDALERDCAELFSAAPDDFFLTVNLCVKELMGASAARRILGGPLAAYSPRIVVEVTESIELLEDTEAMRNLRALTAAGVPLAIDDFGTGFSNLAQLHLLRPTLIKFDRSLIARAVVDPIDWMPLMRAAVAAAESLHCDVIAEGVESAEEAAAVSSLNLRYSQGYRYHRPMVKTALIKRLQTAAFQLPGPRDGSVDWGAEAMIDRR